MSKEIGKLLKLLNEYKPLNKGVHYEYNNGLFIMYDGSGREIGTSIEDEILISKKFGFIQWLVENEKIDLVKVYKNLNDYEIEIRIRAVKELLQNNEEDTISYLKLLMLLSIQDEPIKFLLEILK